MARAERAGHGPRGGGVREGGAAPAGDGRHVVGRPRRDEHDHRCRASRWRTGSRCCSSPGTPSCRACPIRCCSRSSTSAPRRRRSTTASVRSCASGIASCTRRRSSARCRRPSARCSTRPTAAPCSSACRRTSRRRRTTTPRSSSRSRCTRSPDRDRTSGRSCEQRTRSAQAKRPVIIAGGGVHYSRAEAELAAFAEEFGIPVVETVAGKSCLLADHPRYAGPVGVTGAGAGQRRRDRGRSRHRDRHAPRGLHDGLVDGVRPVGALRRRECRPLRRHQAPLDPRRGRRARVAGRPRRRAARLDGRGRVDVPRHGDAHRAADLRRRPHRGRRRVAAELRAAGGPGARVGDRRTTTC